MQKSFMIGVVLGAAAMSAYEMGNRAKNQVECQKEKIKKKLEKLLCKLKETCFSVREK